MFPPWLLAEVSDKAMQVPTFWIIAATGAAVAAIARGCRWARRATMILALAWAGLNILDVLTVDDPIRQAIVVEMGRGYSVHQFTAALLPLMVALVPLRGGGRHDGDKTFSCSS
ncbi:MAG: hypothetical protein JWN40_2055 [Phycisphaerales bacterium]|nr:hypothetical protein [Phycisphaerales bacterium]